LYPIVYPKIRIIINGKTKDKKGPESERQKYPLINFNIALELFNFGCLL
jgi:hypothetical protein